jgi:hypothetical protein
MRLRLRYTRAHKHKVHSFYIGWGINLRGIETLQIHSTSQTRNATSPAQKQHGIAVFIMSHPLLERIGHYYFHPLPTQNGYFDINRTTPVF